MFELTTAGGQETPSLETNKRKYESLSALELNHHNQSNHLRPSTTTSMSSRPQSMTLRPESIRVLISISMLLHQSSAGVLTSSSSHFTNLNLMPDHHNHLYRNQHQGTSGAKFRIVEATEDQLVPPEQRLALKILIRGDDDDHGQQQLHRKPDRMRQPARQQNSTKRPQLRQPYDFTEALKNYSFNDHSAGGEAPFDRHYYTIDNSLTSQDNIVSTRASSNLDNETSSTVQYEGKQSTTTKSPQPIASKRAGSRSELIRTQHQPPWLRPQRGHKGRNSVLAQILPDGHHPKLVLGNKNLRLKLTTVAPAITTTEFYRLISSAHSPIKISLDKLNILQREGSGTKHAFPMPGDHHRLFVQEPVQMNAPLETMPATTQATIVPSTTTTASAASSPPTQDQDNSTAEVPNLSTRSAAHAPQQRNHSRPSVQRVNQFNHDHEQTTRPQLDVKAHEPPVKTTGQVMSPEIVIKDDGEMFVNESDLETSPLPDEELDGRRHVINYTISADHTAFKRPVTIVRHSPKRRRNSTRAPAHASSTSTTTEMAKFFTVPSRIRIRQTSAPRLTQPPSMDESTVPLELEGPTRRPPAVDGDNGPASAILSPPQVVRLISKQKHKYDDNVTSPPLTVIDNDAFRLPPNTTAVHNNRLLVRSKPGQFSPARFQVTTEYPYYNPVAGITPPYPSGQQASSTTLRPQRPASLTGPNFGLIRPVQNNSDSLLQAQNHSTFGAPNIKFPAKPAGMTGNEPPPTPDSVAVIPNRLNVSVPEDANLVGPNRVPDKLTVDNGEQLNLSSSGSAVVTSDATLVGRPPYGQTTFANPDGIVRLSTTRRPNRFSTTKRINIVSANTTVITTNPDELHDVLINSIAGSHQQGHHVSQRPPPPERPGLLASIGKIFNASVATTAIALMTLIKTILIALLVMFLPPIALTAAIVQAVSMAG